MESLNNKASFKKTIYIPIEIKARELASQVLLAACAAEKGFRIYIGTKPAMVEVIRLKKKGGIYLYKGSHTLGDMMFIDSKCDAFAVLDQEIGPVIQDYEISVAKRFWPGTAELVDRYYVIGSMAAAAARKVLSLRGRVVITGWPRIDLWRRRFNSLYADKARRYKNKYGDFLLFTSDFGVNSKKKIHGRYQQSRESSISEISGNAEKCLERAEGIFAEFRMFVELLKAWDNDPDIPRIIVRPHPSEDIPAWEQELIGLKKTTCVYEGAVDEWIHAAKGVIHRGCTSGLQAFVLKKPVGYIVTDEKRIRHELPYKVSMAVKTTSELKEWVKSFGPNSKLEAKESEEIEISGFGERVYMTEKLASELIVDDFMNLSVRPETQLKNSPKMQTKVYLKSWLRLINIFVPWCKDRNKDKKRREDSNRYKIAPFEQKMPGGITVREVKELLGKISPDKKFEVRQCIKNCVLIEM